MQLAVALVHQPDLLMLDEPFSGLDPIGTDLMRALLVERAEAGATVVFSSHQLDLVQGLCQDVVIIHKGRFVVGGPVEELRAAGPDACRWVRCRAGSRRFRAPASSVATPRTAAPRWCSTSDADPQLLLADAQRAGPVDHFSVELAPLSDVFRAAVAS